MDPHVPITVSLAGLSESSGARVTDTIGAICLFHVLMTGASATIPDLIVRQHEDDVRTLGGLSRGSEQGTENEDQNSYGVATSRSRIRQNTGVCS